MPIYIDPTGRACTADQAMSGGRLKPGFHETLADGERAGFSLAFRDSAPTSSGASHVFLTNGAVVADAAIVAAVERERMIHETRFAFMGDKAPTFDRERAIFLAQATQSAAADRAVRDAVRDGDVAAQISAVSDARREMLADLHSGASVRDAARAAQYL